MSIALRYLLHTRSPMLIVQIPLYNHRGYLSRGIEPATGVLFVYHHTPGKPRGGVPSGASSNIYSNHHHAEKMLNTVA
jgi:hypothetical protein